MGEALLKVLDLSRLLFGFRDQVRPAIERRRKAGVEHPSQHAPLHLETGHNLRTTTSQKCEAVPSRARI